MNGVWQAWGEAAWTSLGFFWKAGWAFVLGYFVSGMIQAFVPKARLTRHMGGPGLGSVALATGFGAASSSCSFAALAAARSLVQKGAHFVAAVAFMFASTNLVIELGVLIVIFLGWPFLGAEIVGGLLLIAISSLLIRATYPSEWMREARRRAESRAEPEDADFDWRQRLRSREGWQLVGHRFAMDWRMVWEEIVIGFTVAGLVAVLVPSWFWARLFLVGPSGGGGGFLVSLENATVAPFVAAATFIGSMGNIPLATVLNANGVMFAGIIGFIYSDLMVPPLVAINAKYFGLKVAMYIAGVMYISIVLTALALHHAFALLGIVPESGRRIDEVSRFALDYTFWMNLVFAGLTWVAVRLHRAHVAATGVGADDGLDTTRGRPTVKRIVVYLCLIVVGGGVVVHLFAGPLF